MVLVSTGGLPTQIPAVTLVNRDGTAYNPAVDVPAGTYADYDETPDLHLLNSGESVPPRLFCNGLTASNSSGFLYLSYITARKTESVTQVRGYNSTAAAATPTLCRVGIYSVAANGDLTLAASTPNDTALWSVANAEYTKALSVPLSKVAGSRYAIGYIVVSGTTVPQFRAFLAAAFGATGARTLYGRAPRMMGRLTGQTDLPASILAASVGEVGEMIQTELLP